jgi:HrpA-like RNA helicase
MIRPLLSQGKLYSVNPSVQRVLDEWIPIEYICNWIKQHEVEPGVSNRLLVIKAETASGKSTIIPPVLYKRFVAGGQAPGIICTQPRVLTAIENVGKMSEYNRELRLGITAGWNTGINKVIPEHTSVLISATIGVLLMQLRAYTDAEITAKYRFIVIDEVHERSQETDMTLCMLKNFLIRNSRSRACPFVILMSATFDQEEFLKYYGITDPDSNFIWCRSQPAGFDERWDWPEISGTVAGNIVPRVTHNYFSSIAKCVELICREGVKDDTSKSDVLVFLPSMTEIIQVGGLLRTLNEKFASEDLPVFSVLMIDGESVARRTKDYKRAMGSPLSKQIQQFGTKFLEPNRRVILATNVAETGLSLDCLKYVVDSGFSRESEYHPIFGVNALITKVACKQNVIQRKGRAGRYFRGVFYPMYPLFIYNKLADKMLPKILLEDIGRNMMGIIFEQTRTKLEAFIDPSFSVNDIDMMVPPSSDTIAAQLEKLYALGFVSPQGLEMKATVEDTLGSDPAPTGKFALTALGLLAYRQTCAPETTRMILAAFNWGVAPAQLVSIAAYIEASGGKPISVFYARDKKRPIVWSKVYNDGLPDFISGDKLAKVFSLLLDEFFDGLILYGAVLAILRDAPNAWEGMRDLDAWCEEANIDRRAVVGMLTLRDGFMENFLASDIDVTKVNRTLATTTEETFMDYVKRIKHCIYDGYRCNVLTADAHGVYTSAMGVEVVIPKILARVDAAGKTPTQMPRRFLYKTLDLKMDKKSHKYKVMANGLCALDGFVAIDPEFLR